MLKFKRVRSGFYATADGKWGVMIDGYGYVPVDEYRI